MSIINAMISAPKLHNPDNLTPEQVGEMEEKVRREHKALGVANALHYGLPHGPCQCPVCNPQPESEGEPCPTTSLPTTPGSNTAPGTSDPSGDAATISEIRKLRAEIISSELLMRSLPEDPGYNGSRLIIDDVEAERIAKVLGSAENKIEFLTAAVSSPRAAATPSDTEMLDMLEEFAKIKWSYKHTVEVKITLSSKLPFTSTPSLRSAIAAAMEDSR